MTYDFSRSASASSEDGPREYGASLPNAPLPWVEQIIRGFVDADESFGGKLLLGIPLYGWRGTEALTGV